eukprot:CAMPEP_0172488170 /NCGR_PEP_ID=MMETSP1066-20121228/17573_1 /TAXON_ID=671091 /ORGANISM="Coscinodiscus wailesii, Strain CCMP2513" /LENGTH=124 /DNA_ID=CAMNT_0013255225 /DNA_START=65 /DNA_END=436 /DNA_ORIENTATION=-
MSQQHQQKHPTIIKRNQLFKPSNQKRKKKPPKHPINEAKNITDTLLRTKSLMRQQLEQTHAVTEVIQNDGSLLNETKTEHLGLGGVVAGAKGALSSLKAQDNREVVLFYAAVGFYALVAFYVVW